MTDPDFPELLHSSNVDEEHDEDDGKRSRSPGRDSVPQNSNRESEAKMVGTCKWFDPSKGFGFIVVEDGGPDIFVHHSDILGEKFLLEGSKVEFTYVMEKGKPKAKNVTGPDGAKIRIHGSKADPTFARRLARTPAVLLGTIKWFNPKKGFGFLIPFEGGEDVFVHHSQVLWNTGAAKNLTEGADVEFKLKIEINEGKEKRTATNVTAPGGNPLGSAAPRGADGYEGSSSVSALGGLPILNYAQGLGPTVSVPVSIPTAGGGTTVSYVQVPLAALSGLTAAATQAPAHAYADRLSSSSFLSSAGSSAISTGTVKWFDTKKGYGFIVPHTGGKEVFVHESSLKPGTKLNQGQSVEFQTELKGDSLKAISVTVRSSGSDSPIPASSAPSLSRKRKGSIGGDSGGYDTSKAMRPTSYDPYQVLINPGYEFLANPAVYPVPSPYAHAQLPSYRYEPSHRSSNY